MGRGFDISTHMSTLCDSETTSFIVAWQFVCRRAHSRPFLSTHGFEYRLAHLADRYLVIVPERIEDIQ